MPIATGLPARNVTLRFPPSSSSRNPDTAENGEEDIEETYQLLELPAEILKQVEGLKGKNEVFPLTIKGRPSDDATLCTPQTTFMLRTVGISNSLLVCRTPSSSSLKTPTTSSSSLASSSSSTLEVRDTCHQILECVPIAPNLERIRTVLKDSAWQGLGSGAGALGKRKRANGKKEKRWTRAMLGSVIQASEGELERGLKERCVVEVDGRMLLLPPAPLKDLLTILLSLLTIHYTTSLTTSPIAPIVESLEEDHDIPLSLSQAVLNLFGTIEGETWEADAKGLVREVGRGLLVSLRGEKKRDDFLEEWKAEVGETWAEHVDLTLLEGDYLLSPPPLSALSSFKSPSPILSYFPVATLPLQPATRFADLFLTRPRWRPEEMAPFLKGLTRDGDTKERDKLVAKFVRVVKEKEGAWWYPRRTA
ncbi:hypothetical protein CI109_103106 [Kwoniella shandongensis]|uniref:Uncharacterized protein n=1 Tax=Kwoniella shandongensis TaxID=1734106 RepID=A0A5M6C8H2_9TREE|nr:uncharacterized protein CI109_000297 [Kwoniella shandongensis]KAA5531456.1 hypothetical protein CI109_000297 [Kwoniella shandongensis]